MAIDFQSVSIPVHGGPGTKVVEATAIFGSKVVKADAAVKGFVFDYSSSDHHINVIEVTASAIPLGNTGVRVRVVCRYADKNLDDAYTGHVRVLVVARVE